MHILGLQMMLAGGGGFNLGREGFSVYPTIQKDTSLFRVYA